MPCQCTSPVKITLFTCEQARDVALGDSIPDALAREGYRQVARISGKEVVRIFRNPHAGCDAELPRAHSLLGVRFGERDNPARNLCPEAFAAGRRTRPNVGGLRSALSRFQPKGVRGCADHRSTPSIQSRTQPVVSSLDRRGYFGNRVGGCQPPDDPFRGQPLLPCRLQWVFRGM